MAKFALATDKSLIVRSALVSLEAGEVETDDEALCLALRGALDVVEVETVKKQKPKGSE